MSVDIEVEAPDVEAEEVNLGTSKYWFKSPKTAPILTAIRKAQIIQNEEERSEAIFACYEQWLSQGFGPKQWAHIQARLQADSDPLDLHHIIKLFTALFEKGQGGDRPPTWRGDYSEVSPQAFQREAALKLIGSTSEASPLGVPATS